MITFVIGDIHGMYDALDEVLESVNTYICEREIVPDTTKLVFLGDYIDRGPDSFKVVNRIRTMQIAHPDRVVTLRGNHEQMLMDAYADPLHDGELFYINGGKQTLQSYGITDLEDLPAEHLKFFRDTRYYYEDDLRYYVHAGIAPYRKLSEQTNSDRLWIREGFLEHTGDFEKFVVHGHTPRPHDRQNVTNRMNMDFAAVFGGHLVCAIFNDTEVEPFNYITVGPLSRPIRDFER